MHKITFTNENSMYPTSAEQFFKTTGSGYSIKHFEKWYKVVEKHISKRVTYDDNATTSTALWRYGGCRLGIIIYYADANVVNIGARHSL